MADTPVEQMKKHIARKEKLIAKHKDELAEAKATLRKICPHANKDVTEHFHEGGYLNKAYTEYKIKCADCGMDLGQKTEIHSYYSYYG